MSDRSKLYPLIFEPVLKDYIWGGRKLEKLFHRRLPDNTNIAESWEIAAHTDGDTVVKNGAFAGISLSDLYQQLGIGLIGTRAQWAHERGKFPLLIKLLDANQSLSVQVHPPDAYALAHEGNELGKTEMWVVLHTEPDAAIILGVREGTTRDCFEEAIDAGMVEQHLHRIPVKAGDVVCVPSGSLHAILKGVVLAEIQQNSNTTYRVYDWNRAGNDGKPRLLHVEKALDVINFGQVEPRLGFPPLTWHQDRVCAYLLYHNEYFVTERIEMARGVTYTGQTDGSSMEIWGVIYGQAFVQGNGVSVKMDTIQFALMPATLGSFTIHTTAETTLLRIYLP